MTHPDSSSTTSDERPPRAELSRLPTPATTLRPATPSDEPFLLQLYASTRTEELAQTGWSVVLVRFEDEVRATDRPFRRRVMSIAVTQRPLASIRSTASLTTAEGVATT